MKNQATNIILKKAPILRHLVALAIGILVQYHGNIPIFPFLLVAAMALFVLAVFRFAKLGFQFSFGWLAGCALAILFVALGGILSFTKNGANDSSWLGNHYKEGQPVLLTLQEPLVTKAKSLKALAKAEAILINNQWQQVDGNVLLYFKKDTTLPSLHYGSQLVVTKPLSAISRAGNPGGFNYQQYCAFQHTYYQAFLSTPNYLLLKTTKTSLLDAWIFKARFAVLAILRKNIPGTSQLSVAEALLIGYRDDLDRELVQAYSNTGVVHIIAISGLHLGMIYGLIVSLFSFFKPSRWIKLAKPVTIIIVLWGFSFIAGAAPSILRSAVMFTFIALGEGIGKRTNIYNNLAASAFVILLINPFSLWDVGFQLSYAAVLSIVLFSKHIQHWFYFENKLLHGLWGLCSVTIAAQILTLPLILYHFHQLPTLFLFTNLLAVPLSGFILYAELVLLIVSFISPLAMLTGKITAWLIGLMNNYITRVNDLPFSVWEGIQISIPQALLLYGSIIGIACWLLYKKQQWLFTAMAFLVTFIILRSMDFITKAQQKQLIVYNIPQHTAIDIVEGSQYQFLGDSLVAEDAFLRNFHLQPCRVLNRISPCDSLPTIAVYQHIITTNGKTILIIDKPLPKHPPISRKIKADVIIITHNPKIYFSQLPSIFDCKKYVFDASNPAWKVRYWEKDAARLQQHFYTVASKGAFIMGL
ncbi:ComEC/Rec2 family competence protein [Parasediminibacterium sp. JCM 36343]|uniref:ComEC/Rec2 family competence protein n=1 Tax=Parasediminibacterium sp. JCM 36343 TaxID=3374279 RepID=UPI003978930C